MKTSPKERLHMSLLNNLSKSLGFYILVAMILGVLTGVMMGEGAAVFEPLGAMFISLIKMLVVPLIVFSVIGGSAGVGATSSAGKVGGLTLFFFMIMTILAVSIALLFGELFKPGVGVNLSSLSSMFSNEYADRGGTPAFFDIILGMIPTNPIKAMVEGNILQILFFCIFLGFGISMLEESKRSPLIAGLNALTEAMIWMINKVMLIAPIGVFALMAESIGTYGFETLVLIMKLVVVYLFALALFNWGIYGLVVQFFTNLSLKEFFGGIKSAQIVAFSTASSMATVPVTMDAVENKFKINKSLASFIVPLGATINMNGNAIYYALTAVFFAQFYGIELTWAHYGAIILTSTIGSIGQAGVPGPTLLVVAVLMSAGIPIEGLPILYALDRIFDMTRTAVNITGDALCAAVVEKYTQGEKSLA